MDFFLPQGKSAALMPEASYSIPGLFLYSDLIYECLNQVESKFGYRIPVSYLYGSPKVLWNCGRLILTENRYSLSDMEKELKEAANRGITPLLTFSVPTIQEEDLSDPVCNALLDMLEPLHGGVILSNPCLKAYIEARCPHVECHASVIQTAYMDQRDLAYYSSLAREYSRFVVHPDDNYDWKLLEDIPKERAEIIVNERCVYGCRQRRDHYDSMPQDQKNLITGTGPVSRFIARCPFVPDIKQKHTAARNISLTAAHTRRLSEMGYPLFKLQGRLDIPYVFFFDFLRFTLENEVAFPAMYPIFSFTIREYWKKREKQRNIIR